MPYGCDRERLMPRHRDGTVAPTLGIPIRELFRFRPLWERAFDRERQIPGHRGGTAAPTKTARAPENFHLWGAFMPANP